MRGRAFAELKLRVERLDRLLGRLLIVAVGALVVALLALGIAARAAERSTRALQAPQPAKSVER